MSDEIDLSYAVASYRINSPLNIVDAVGKHFVRRPCSDVLRFLAYMPLDGRDLFKAASIERQDCCFLPDELIDEVAHAKYGPGKSVQHDKDSLWLLWPEPQTIKHDLLRRLYLYMKAGPHGPDTSRLFGDGETLVACLREIPHRETEIVL